MAVFFKDYDVTAGNNTGSSSDGWLSEGVNYSEVNNAYREFQATLARWRKDTDSTLDSTGSANAYVLTTNQTFTALARGDRVRFEANHTNTGASTLNVDTLGATSIVDTAGNALTANQITAGGVYETIYDGTNWQLIGTGQLGGAGGGQPYDAGLTDIAGLTPADDTIIVGDGANWVAETGNTARTSLGLGTTNFPTFAELKVKATTLGGSFEVENAAGNSSIFLRADNAATSGNLWLGTDGVLSIKTGSFIEETHMQITNGGSVALWQGGSEKFSTTAGGASVTGTLGVTGSITVTGTVDGRDVAADGIKLDGIEANAKDDQTITAGAGLTGGGSGNPTLNVGGSSSISVAADSISVIAGGVAHDSLSGFVANEHINHGSVSITAGTGLSGGGTIAATRTINLSQATTGALGGVELATQAEVNAGTDTQRAVVPSTLKNMSASTWGTSSLGTNGYMEFPGGLTIAWGAAAVNSGSTISYGVTFTSIYQVVATYKGTGIVDAEEAWGIDLFTTTTFRVNYKDLGGGTSGKTFSWIAIGVK